MNEKTREGPPLRAFKHIIYNNIISLFYYNLSRNKTAEVSTAFTHKHMNMKLRLPFSRMKSITNPTAFKFWRLDNLDLVIYVPAIIV